MTTQRYAVQPTRGGRREIVDTANPTAGPGRNGVVGHADTDGEAKALAEHLERGSDRAGITILDGRRHPGRSRR